MMHKKDYERLAKAYQGKEIPNELILELKADNPLFDEHKFRFYSKHGSYK